ncbi:hypothetical protein G6038_12715 [Rhodococcus sp. 14C212]|uniref:alpha/beta fold hydrolase n=1 Tax=Rhodococcus sp. 14C212 TaxID=2711209 RepID=UPI0013E9CA4A|nr:hypothetical protein [Rhodococcus sp. 14C212]NGP06328.1 hypothetical protein [Rhodococcus sp. 14C212]
MTPPSRAESAWWTDGQAAAALRDGRAVHLYAAGADAEPALRAADRHGSLLRSLILADPVLDVDVVAGLLGRITVPTLVVASALGDDTDLTAAQRLAGEIDNGVFVVVDGCPAPVHLTRPESFTEWAGAFAAIAEGLAARYRSGLAAPTPHIEGVFA